MHSGTFNSSQNLFPYLITGESEKKVTKHLLHPFHCQREWRLVIPLQVKLQGSLKIMQLLAEFAPIKPYFIC